jgi:putative ABC transport system ATP-binding protein
VSDPSEQEASRPAEVEHVIRLAHVSKTYASGDLEVHALRDVSLDVVRGDFVAVMGASGSGKSTMMNIIGLLDVPSRGWFQLDGVDVRTLDERELAQVRNRKIGFVFQSFNLVPRTSALANVELPLAYAGVRRRDRRARALTALDVVGLGDRAGHLPSQLSGGQQQRVAIARALSTKPALLLADEPTGNLDSVSTHEVMEVLRGLHVRGRTIVVITHEQEVAAYADRIITLHDGRLVDDTRTTTTTATTAAAGPELRLVGPGSASGPRRPAAAGEAG